MNDIGGCNPHCRDCDDHTPHNKECEEHIVCSQAKVAECEAKLFCEVTQRLGCEIRHACGLKELTRLVNLTNSFLEASAQKEKTLGGFVKDAV